MKIKIDKIANGHYKADCLDIPGSPRIGVGKTKKDAVANLFIILYSDKYIDKIDMNRVIFIE